MSTPTAANVKQASDSHWYYLDGTPCYELPKADGNGMKKPTLADARKLNLLPSVTTILKVLDKPELTAWKIEQAVLAILTTPRQPGEADDAFTKRVLSTDRVQDEEAQTARDRGTQIHAAMEALAMGKESEVAPDLLPWVKPAFDAVAKYGKIISTEVCVTGNGYAGKLDAAQQSPPVPGQSHLLRLWDWKSSKKLPDKGAWKEHRLQLAAYAKAFQLEIWKQTGHAPNIKTGNVYISTTEQGKFAIWEHDEWLQTFDQGFGPLVVYWQWLNQYFPDRANK